MIFWVIFLILPVYMTLLMTAWCKSKFTMLCKHVIVYCGWQSDFNQQWQLGATN